MRTSLTVQFNASIKHLITSLILTPAYASVLSGTSMRTENLRSDSIEKGVTDLLFTAFHSDPENSDQASFADLFAKMAGPFEAFIVQT